MRAIALLALIVAGCSEYELVEYDGVDTFVQSPAEEVDILLIVDDSCSMEPYQNQLGRNFESFITYFVDANVNYHIGVTTTDVEVDAGRILGDVITPETENPADTFSDIVNVGTGGSGFEMGLEAALMALTPPVVDQQNQGFLRETASLSIIFVSDEEDGSPLPVNDYINSYRDVKGQRSRDVFNASALTVTNEEACTQEQALASSPGDRYIDVARQTSGVIGNLCSDAFDEIVTDLSLNVSRLHDTFYLSSEPDVSTLKVFVDETEIACDAGAWSFQRVADEESVERPAVVFDRSHLPEPGQQVTVRYYFGDGDPADFCTGGAE